jgi:hypothetical protein
MQFAAFTKRTFLTVSFLGVPFPSPPRLAVRPLRYQQVPDLPQNTSLPSRPATRAKALNLLSGALSRVENPLPRPKVRGWHSLNSSGRSSLAVCPDYTVWAPSLHTSEESR